MFRNKSTGTMAQAVLWLIYNRFTAIPHLKCDRAGMRQALIVTTQPYKNEDILEYPLN